MVKGDERVFKALSDATRRELLDRLHADNGLTLAELCDGLAMSRQAATQHLDLLEAANLISTVRRGRHKLHYLNPVPLQEIQERWIAKFEAPRLRALSTIKRKAEDMSSKPSYQYVTYIRSTPEAVWHALTDADLTAEYWGHAQTSDWKVGSPWSHRRPDGSGIDDVVGNVLESVPPRRLVLTWAGADQPEIATRVTFDIDPGDEIVRLTVTHEDIPTDHDYELLAHGWPAVFANLKSMLETGKPLPQRPWEMAQ